MANSISLIEVIRIRRPLRLVSTPLLVADVVEHGEPEYHQLPEPPAVP